MIKKDITHLQWLHYKSPISDTKKTLKNYHVSTVSVERIGVHGYRHGFVNFPYSSKDFLVLTAFGGKESRSKEYFIYLRMVTYRLEQGEQLE